MSHLNNGITSGNLEPNKRKQTGRKESDEKLVSKRAGRFELGKKQSGYNHARKNSFVSLSREFAHRCNRGAKGRPNYIL